MVAVLAYALTGAGPYGLRVLTLAGVYGLNVIGYQFIFGHAGALSLAQATFFGIGAYTTALLSLHLGLDLTATFPASILVATLIATAVAIPVLRLETHYLALATLGISQVALLIATNWESVTGGANGLPNIPGIVVFGHAFGRGMPTFLVVWLCLGLGLGLAAWILTPRRRLDLEIQRTRPLAAAAIGIDRDSLRLAGLLLSAAFGGAAGALYVHTTRVISPDALAFSILVLTLAMTVIGGRVSLAGALIGALLLTHIPEWFRFLDRYYLLAYGAAMLAVVVFAPNGLSALVDRIGLLRIALPDRPGTATTSRSARERQGADSADRSTGLALEIARLAKSFGGVQAVNIAQLTVPAGQVCGVIGPNGSGKTTLLNLISGLDRADAGSIHAFGSPLDRQPAHRRADLGVARCFQHPMLLDDRSVLDNVAAGVSATRGLAAARLDAAAALERCGLGEIAMQPCGALAFGQRRLTELARAFAAVPRLVLLDEPAAGLADGEKRRLADLVAQSRSDGVTWLVVDHDVAFLADLSDRLVCLDGGAIIADGAPRAVLANPTVRRAYFGMIPAAGDRP